MEQPADSIDPRDHRASPRIVTSTFVAATMVAMVASALALFFVWVLWFRDPTPLLTEADYEAAVKRWDERGPAGYDLDLELSGSQTGRIHLEVRDGEVARMTRNGVEPKQRRTWDYWAVPNQLDLIGQEMEMSRDPQRGFHAPEGSQVVQRAAFDPALGYPRLYHRVVVGTPLEIQWVVTRFEPK